jgi:putative membrane protein
MKTVATILFGTVLILSGCSSSEKDSVKQAQEQNQNSAIDEDISKFLTEAADARMMGIEQGKLAKERATNASLRKYGERMISDQTKLLHEIRVLAASKNIVLPTTLSNDKADGLEDLKEKEGEDFDDKFLKMMRLDHKRDVNKFEDAMDFKDKDVKQFASNYLPVIESHLASLEEIQDSKDGEITERKASEYEN